MKNDGAESFFALKNDGAEIFIAFENDEAETFSIRKNTRGPWCVLVNFAHSLMSNYFL
jgi:hypothetical protein